MQLSFLPPADTYWTIAAPTVGEYREKSSKFLAYAFEIRTEQDVRQHLDAIRKEHFKATHHCYAYRLGTNGTTYRANDDGEPSGTAGRPILGQIDSFGLTNVLIVVVRYYGGIKLGTSGLKEAYKVSARLALEPAQRVERIVEQPFALTFEYAQLSEVMGFLKENGFAILENVYNERARLVVSVRLSGIETLKQGLENLPNLSIEDLPML